MSRAVIALGVTTVVLAAVATVIRFVPVRLAASAPMGTSISVDVRGDGSETLYARSSDPASHACTTRRDDATTVHLRSDMFAQPLPGIPSWRPLGAFVGAGRLTVSCTGAPGGSFGVGPTRSVGYLLLLTVLVLGGASAAASALVVGLVSAGRRRRAAAG